MFNIFKKKIGLYAPVTGDLINLEQVRDPVFSGGLMGKGFAIEPKSNKIYSPVEGSVVSIFPTKHAVIIKNKLGIEMLLHMGIDTVELNGAGFTIRVNEGEKITKDTLLAEIDFDQLKEQKKDNTIIIVFPESKAMINIVVGNGSVARNELIGEIIL